MRLLAVVVSAAVALSGLLPQAAAATDKLDPKLDPKGNPKADVRWEFNRFNDSITTSPAIGSDGTIYIGTKQQRLYAINPDGTLKWEIALGNIPYGTPAIGSDGTIYVHSNYKLYAIDPVERKEKWNIQTIEYVVLPEYVSSPAIGDDGTIFVGGNGGKGLFAVNPDGTPKWGHNIGDIGSSPTVGADGTIYVGSNAGNLYAIKPNGLKKWVFDTKSRPVVAAPSIGVDGTIYARSFAVNKGAELYAVKPDGAHKWTRADFQVLSMPAIGADGMFYLADNKKLTAYDSPIGVKKWDLEFGSPVKIVKTPDAGGMIYAATDNHVFYAISADGKVQWGYPVDDVGANIPAAGSDGTVYVAGKKTLYALGTVAASSVSLNKKIMNLQAGSKEPLTATVVPDNAANKKVKWSSSDRLVAEVDSTGNVTGIAPGTAKITATTEEGGFAAACIVTVIAASGSKPLEPGIEPAKPATKPPAADQPSVPKLTDISGHWAGPEIGKAAELGIINGYSDNTFRPDAGVTRAEFAAMLTRGIKPVTEGLPLSFADKDEIGVWAVQPVAQAVQLGIVNGYDDGTFRPNASITHAEMIAMVVRASGHSAAHAERTGFADDADIPLWAKPSVSKAEETGIIIVGGIAGGRFAPQEKSTRAEAASAIVRMLNIRR